MSKFYIGRFAVNLPTFLLNVTIAMFAFFSSYSIKLTWNWTRERAASADHRSQIKIYRRYMAGRMFIDGSPPIITHQFWQGVVEVWRFKVVVIDWAHHHERISSRVSAALKRLHTIHNGLLKDIIFGAWCSFVCCARRCSIVPVGIVCARACQ